MARESRRKRAERRFGKEERLFDRLWLLPWLHDPDLLHEPAEFLDLASTAIVVSADNVAEFYLSNSEKLRSWTELPPVRLPFSPLFVEADLHSGLGHVVCRQSGVLLFESHPSAHFDALADAHCPVDYSGTRIHQELPSLRERCTRAIDFGFVGLMDGRGDARIVHLFRGTLFIDDAGNILRSPLSNCSAKFFRSGEINQAKALFWDLLFPLILAVSFMNCRNVSLSASDPSPEINRARIKAGLRPFVRYHTINIEPMKSVLRTEGDIEANGLKRALHICRGHFAHYTDTFMGRPLSEPMTVWRPSHVRGSAKDGVVFSDYSVNAPATESLP